jgi:hypothetical protein
MFVWSFLLISRKEIIICELNSYKEENLLPCFSICTGCCYGQVYKYYLISSGKNAREANLLESKQQINNKEGKPLKKKSRKPAI